MKKWQWKEIVVGVFALVLVVGVLTASVGAYTGKSRPFQELRNEIRNRVADVRAEFQAMKDSVEALDELHEDDSDHMSGSSGGSGDCECDVSEAEVTALQNDVAALQAELVSLREYVEGECTIDDDCAAEEYCSYNHCLPDKGEGSYCDRDAECFNDCIANECSAD